MTDQYSRVILNTHDGRPTMYLTEEDDGRITFTWLVMGAVEPIDVWLSFDVTDVGDESISAFFGLPPGAELAPWIAENWGDCPVHAWAEVTKS